MLVNGRRLNWEASLRLAERLDIRPRECFVNCADALVRTPELARWRYVEGFILTPSEPAALMLHGWLLTPEQAIVDPTLALSPGMPARLYLPAHLHTRAQMAPRIARRDWLPLMVRYHEETGGLVDMRDPWVRAAWRRGRNALRAYSHVLPPTDAQTAEISTATNDQGEEQP